MCIAVLLIKKKCEYVLIDGVLVRDLEIETRREGRHWIVGFGLFVSQALIHDLGI